VAPTPTPIATPAPGTFAIPAAGGTIALPAMGGVAPSFTILAGAAAGTTGIFADGATAPASAPAPSSTVRRGAALGVTPFLYITATFSTNVPGGVVADEVLELSNTFSQTAGYLCELDDITSSPGTKLATYGPATPAGTTSKVTIANGVTGSAGPALIASHTYLFQFYVQPAASPSPSPTASPSPSPSASASASASPTVSPSPSPSPVASATPTPGPSPLGTYMFSGPTVTGATVTPPTAPAPLVVPATGTYGTYGVSMSIVFGSASTTAPFALTAALGSQSRNDISPSTYPFYTGTAATPLFYIQVTSSAPVTFPMTPAVTLTAMSYVGGNMCSLFIYTNTTGGYVWTAVPGATGTINGSTVVIPSVTLPSGLIENFSPGGSTPAFIGC
jgi:hypothetical protein